MTPTKHTTTDKEILHAFQAAEQALEAVQKAARTIAISGTLLLEKKATLQHGEWLPWLAEHGIHERQARRHMDLARGTMGRLEIGHDVRFAGLTFGQCLTLPETELPPLAQKARDEFEKLVMGKTARQLSFDWSTVGEDGGRKVPGGSHQIQFTCPHCGAPNKGFVGRQITCFAANCRKKITVKADGPTAQEKIEHIIEGEQEVALGLIASMNSWCAREYRAEAGRGLLQQMLDAQIELGKAIREALKPGKK